MTQLDRMTELARLLDDGARFDAEYRAGLSNHLPMALLALHRLGAPGPRLQAFAAGYACRLEPAPLPLYWSGTEPWVARLGQRAAWPAYRTLFGQWLARSGNAAVLEQALPELMRGCGAAAFHGLIRSACALQAGHAGELADGLAYWACRHLPLGPAPLGQEPDPSRLLSALQAGLGGWTSEQGLIFQRMADAAAVPAFARTVARLRVGPDTLGALALQAAALYAASGNFTAMHLVTSAHAMRLLLPYVGQPLLAVGHYWCAFAAGFVASGALAAGTAPLLPWQQLVAAAVQSDDEHLVKVVYSCREQERECGGAVWRLAASRALAPQ